MQPPRGRVRPTCLGGRPDRARRRQLPFPSRTDRRGWRLPYGLKKGPGDWGAEPEVGRRGLCSCPSQPCPAPVPRALGPTSACGMGSCHLTCQLRRGVLSEQGGGQEEAGASFLLPSWRSEASGCSTWCAGSTARIPASRPLGKWLTPLCLSVLVYKME